MSTCSSNFTEELILAALSIAILQDKRSMAGVGSILTNWQLQGVRTVSEIPPKKWANPLPRFATQANITCPGI